MFTGKNHPIAGKKDLSHRIFDAVIAFSLERRRSVLAVAIILAAAGTYTVMRLPVDVLPDLNRPAVSVLIESPGLAPEEVETIVTIPIESALLGGPGIGNVRSQSNRGLAQVHVEFEAGSDIYRCRQIVKERIDSIASTLPRGTQIRLGPISSIMGEILLVGITSKDGKNSPGDLRTFADWTVRKQLLSVRGVADITVIGGEAKQYQILIDKNKLSAYDNSLFADNRYISFLAMKESLRGLGENTGGGFIEKEGKELSVRNLGNITDQSDLENSVIGLRGGSPVRIKDIAVVSTGARVKRGDAGVNGNPAVILIIQKSPGVSTVDLTRSIATEIEKIRKANDPDILIHDKLFRQADFIERAVGNVGEAIRDGSIIILIVVFLFLWSFRTTFITLVTLPLSLIAAIVTMAALGVDLNTMTMGGLAVAVGQLVDDSIVDMENIFRRLRENRNLNAPRPALEVVFHASSEVRNSIVLATLVVILVFIPLFFLGDLEGRLFRPLAFAYIVALFASLLVALTVTPVLCYYLLRNASATQNETAIVRSLKAFQRRNLNALLDRPMLSTLIVGVLFLISIGMAPFLKKDFLPSFNEGVFTVFGSLPTATSLPESVARMKEVEEVLLSTKGVGQFARRTGRAEGDEHASGPHLTEIEVNVEPEKAGITRAKLLADLRTKFKSLKGIDLDIGQPISHRIDHMMTGVRSEVAVFVYGDDLEAIQYQAYQIRSVLSKVPGITDLLIENQTKAPELKIGINHAQASSYGITSGEITEVLEFALGGQTVGRTIENGKIFDIVLRFDDKSRAVDGLSGIIIKYLPNGTPVRLGMVAEVYETEGPYEIKRENGSRRIAVQFNTQGRDLGSVVSDVNAALKTLQMPQGIRYEIGGRFASRERAIRLIGIFGFCALVLLTFILYRNFKSWLLVGQILVNVPFSFIGGIGALFVLGVPLSLASILGFIALTGIAARNGIMMISHFLHLMEVEGMEFSRAMVIRGALERLVPVLMTAFSAVFALLPILVSGSDAAGKEILFPVALVISGGLFSSTLLDIIFTPVIFYQVMKRAPNGASS
ncbi:MAG TPA: efflux RND transporter permease subunit [Leptospiraceae bacterium]|nr:CusA/CzcA family heavy metal efflux RND transporter [Leptospirales bacterium]HMW58840.1 efflux RND transporter permease subunit [Leptospiraceae bacterium]HMX57170.1 efflux RND transporter permease subunit [Leptospiraceae bacterium]HNE23755.1 efflux RND transporter permease subunit [Leptospiraceae bacterium]HNL00847.1 efflux RND transporter permease subunit [Leptospiraceae bacterium]